MSTQPVGKNRGEKKLVPKDAIVLPKIMTVEDAADILGVSKMTVYRLIESGDIPHLRVGRSYRIRGDDFDRYLAHIYSGDDIYVQ